MRHFNLRRFVPVAIVAVTAALVLSSCQIWGTDPFQSGQAFRDQVDQLIAETRQFLAGFCSGGAAPAAVLLSLAWLLRRTAGS